MKISAFISELQALQEEHGDVEVNVFDPDKSADGTLEATEARIVIAMGDDDKATGITIVDLETALAFA